MDKTIVVTLNGHAGEYRLDEEAHDRLTRYLDKAARRVSDDSERAEVLGDLERSIGDKLDALLGADERLISAADVDAVLEEIGGGRYRPRAARRGCRHAPSPSPLPDPRRTADRRRLHRHRRTL